MKVTFVSPPETTMLSGKRVSSGALPARRTFAPSAGAALARVKVAVAELPPETLVGSKVKLSSRALASHSSGMTLWLRSLLKATDWLVKR